MLRPMPRSGRFDSVLASFALPVEAFRRRREQWLSPAQIAVVRERRLAHVLEAARSAPYYRELLARYDAERAAPTAILAGLPPLTRQIIAAHGLDAFLTRDRRTLFSVTTSGSTGEPAVFFRSPREEAEFSARWWRVYSAYGCGARDTQVNFTRSNVRPRKGVVKLLRRLGVVPQVVNISTADPIENGARAVMELRPQVIGGYAVAIESLAEYAMERGIELARPRLVVCAAMDVTDHCRDVARRAFGAPVANVYVTNEMGVIAWSCPVRSEVLHVNDDVFVLEILDSDGSPVPDGTSGEIVLTSLTLTSMPLLRYRTGDIAARLPGICNCGRGLALMTPVQGRSAHAIRSADGRLVTAPLVAGAFGAAGAYAWVRRFQVREEAQRVLRVLVEPRRAPSETESAALVRQLEALLGAGFAIRIEHVTEIPLAPSGKFQYVVPLDAGRAARPAVRDAAPAS